MAEYEHLYALAIKGDVDALDNMIKKTNIIITDYVVEHMLNLAAAHGKINIVSYLYGNYQKINSYHALYTACQYGHNLNMIRFIMAKCNYHHINWNFALEAACKGGHIRVIEFIEANQPPLLTLDWDLAFNTACAYGHFELAKAIYTNGSDTKCISRYVKFTIYSALCAACEKGHADIVQFILVMQKDQLSTMHIEEALLCAKLGGHEHIKNIIIESQA